jgi:putative ABC transport system permease protein
MPSAVNFNGILDGHALASSRNVMSILWSDLRFAQLVLLWSKVRGSRDGTSPAEYLEWKHHAKSFQYLEPILPRGFNLSTPQAPERVRARQTSTVGYRMWGEPVFLGRDFAPDEDQLGKNHIVLLRHRL